MTTHSTILENSMERGGCWATDHGVAESDMTQHACMHEPAHTHTHTVCVHWKGRWEWKCISQTSSLSHLT